MDIESGQSKETKTVNLVFPVEMLDWIDTQAGLERRSRANMIRVLVERGLAAMEVPDRD